MNVCWKDGWVVGTGALPGDPGEHDVPGLPTHGCNNLACSRCKRAVRTAVCPKGTIPANAEPRRIYDEILTWPVTPEPTFRVYVCACYVNLEVREDSIHHDYSYDEDLIAWKVDWSCAGHPLAELPRTFDGVLVTAENLEVLVDEAIAGRPPPDLRDPVDADPRVWASRLATRLDGTSHQERVVVAAARHLTSADLETRVRAVHFFADTVRFARAMRPASLLGEHQRLFVGVPNPHATGQMTKTLDRLLWHICEDILPADEDLLSVARASALDHARSSRSLFFALGRRDKAWFAANAVLVARAHPEEKRKDLIDVLRATGLGSAREAIERDARGSVLLLSVLAEARMKLARPDNDFTWSSWEGSEHAVAELDRHLASIERGEIPWTSLSVIFAPTGPMQEVAVSSGWSGELLSLADRYDEAMAALAPPRK